MANCAIVGINGGDEGKGRMVDLLASEYDVVVRYQGGNNAGHTVINQYGKFALHLIPSGIFRPEVINLLGNGTVIDPEALLEEMQSLQAAGVSIYQSQGDNAAENIAAFQEGKLPLMTSFHAGFHGIR